MMNPSPSPYPPLTLLDHYPRSSQSPRVHLPARFQESENFRVRVPCHGVEALPQDFTILGYYHAAYWGVREGGTEGGC